MLYKDIYVRLYIYIIYEYVYIYILYIYILYVYIYIMCIYIYMYGKITSKRLLLLGNSNTKILTIGFYQSHLETDRHRRLKPCQFRRAVWRLWRQKTEDVWRWTSGKRMGKRWKMPYIYIYYYYHYYYYIYIHMPFMFHTTEMPFLWQISLSIKEHIYNCQLSIFTDTYIYCICSHVFWIYTMNKHL